MPVENFLQVNTSLVSAGAAPVNYLPISAIPVDEGDAPFEPAAKIYSSVTAMLADGWLASDAAALSATQVLGQGEHTATPPTRVVVVKRATPVAQVDEFTVATTTDGIYRLFIALIGGLAVQAATFTASGNTTDEIKTGLISSFNGGAFAATHTAATSGVGIGTVTADILGVPFVLTASGPTTGNITLDTTTPNSGLYEDLDAAFALIKFWAVLPDPAEALGTKTEASRWAYQGELDQKTRRNVCLVQTNDANILTATEPNVAATFVGLGHTTTFPLYHVNETDKMNSSWFGRYGGQFPGRRAWSYGYVSGSSAISGVVFSEAQGEAIMSERCSWVERTGPALTDPLRIYWGQGAGGRFVVQKQAEHYWWLRTRQVMDARLASRDGLNIDQDGLNALVSDINVVNTELGSGTSPVIDLARTTITPTPIASIPAGELELGDYKTSGGIAVSTVLIPKLRSVAVSSTFALS